MKHLALPLATLLAAWPVCAAAPPAINLPGYWVCQQALLTPGKNALACYAPAQRDCLRGPVVLAYLKCVSKPGEKVRYQIADTVRLPPRNPHDHLTITTCTNAAGNAQQCFVLVAAERESKEHFGRVKRVWGVRAQDQLAELAPRAFKCLNDNYGAD